MSAYLSPLAWVRLAKYCEMSGDTPDAVHARRRKRQWTDGVQCKVGPDGNLWVNLEEVNKWVMPLPANHEGASPSTSRAA